ncbi:DUF6629 family protein [Kitasatospora sp. DSM 101779]|uniref:DUF6629 family protein n=1 Tax=Kitasatospora sp. DSM 101779 TaxID=2853165 RepID=UPI0021D85213|nr:DUF6629 family protein [Kitasatospora sp. DSM 101779]MCU7821306.1 hypothetical protein [Kitasatospora sp. DSM 101779]
MCWSAEADAAAGVVVAGLGVVCLLRVRDPRRVPLAALPLLLGVHQLVEAAVWLGEDGRIGPGPAQAARTAWALIALPLLPLLVPFGVWCAAGPGGPRRRLLGALAVLGAVVAVPLAVAVLRHPVAAEVRHHMLTYAVGVPRAAVLTVGYLLATLGAPLLSGDAALQRLGLVLGAAAVVCALLWRLAFASTWCALAALAAVLLLGWAGGTGPPVPAGTAGRGPDGGM